MTRDGEMKGGVTITILCRAHIVRAASKDAKGDYGRFLIKRHEANSRIPPVTISFKASEFMKRLATDYKVKCESSINRRRWCVLRMDKRILIKYHQVVQLVSENQSAETSSQSAIADFENKIKGQRALLDKVNADIEKANNGAVVTVKMGANSFASLYAKKEGYEKAIEKSEVELTQMRSAETVRKKEAEKTLKEAKNSFDKLIPAFRMKVKVLFGIVQKVEVKHDAALKTYWNALNEHFDFIEPAISFRALCGMCDIEMLTMDKIFCNERAFINAEVKNLAGFHPDV